MALTAFFNGFTLLLVEYPLSTPLQMHFFMRKLQIPERFRFEIFDLLLSENYKAESGKLAGPVAQNAFVVGANYLS